MAALRAGLVLTFAGVLFALSSGTAAFASAATRSSQATLLNVTITGSNREVSVGSLSALGTTVSAIPTVDLAAAQKSGPGLPPLEATRPDGSIGRVVIVVLLSTVIALWVTLVALVVRVNFTASRRSSKSGSAP